MTRLVLAATSLTLLLGCAIPEEDFPEAYGKAACKRIEECDQGTFENNYDDKADCVDDWADIADAFLDVADLLGADYSEENGRECISEMKNASCGDFESGDYQCDPFE